MAGGRGDTGASLGGGGGGGAGGNETLVSGDNISLEAVGGEAIATDAFGCTALDIAPKHVTAAVSRTSCTSCCRSADEFVLDLFLRVVLRFSRTAVWTSYSNGFFLQEASRHHHHSVEALTSLPQHLARSDWAQSRSKPEWTRFSPTLYKRMAVGAGTASC